MFALTAMSPAWQAVFLGFGCLAFLYAVIDGLVHHVFNAVALGLLLVFFVSFWAALAAT